MPWAAARSSLEKSHWLFFLVLRTPRAPSALDKNIVYFG